MTSKLLAAVVVLGAVVAGSGVAHADKDKKRVVVVLDFEGPKADRFHDELVKIIKQSHTVMSTDKWNGAAEELHADTGSDKDIRKVAAKLGVDAVVEGKVEKRRDEFILRLKLHDGKSGGLVGSPINTKAAKAKLDGKAGSDIKDELVGAIDNVEPNDGEVAERPKKKKFGGGGGDDERGGDKVEKPVKPAVADDPEPPKRPKKVVASTEDDSPPPKKTSKPRKGSGDDDPPPDDGRKPAKKKTASSEDSGGEVDAEVSEPAGGDAALSPGQRAIDAVAGLSLTARKLSFSTAGKPMNLPLDYTGVVVAGAMIDATFYPLAFNHDSHDLLTNLGLNVMFDRVIKIDSREGALVFPTTEQRYSVGAVFRYPFGNSAMAPVAFGSFSYSSQSFTIGTIGTMSSGVPSVKYTIFEPAAGFIYPVTPKLFASAQAGVMLIPKAGDIQSTNQYGGSKLLGLEGSAGIDYTLAKSLFLRVAGRVESIGYTFTGNGKLSSETDPTTMKATLTVPKARDTYLGGFATLGYTY